MNANTQIIKFALELANQEHINPAELVKEYKINILGC